MSYYYPSASKQVDKISNMVRGNGASIIGDLGISSFTDNGTGDYYYTVDNNFFSSTHYGQAESHIGTGSAWATTNASRATSARVATETFLYTGAQGDFSHDLATAGSPA